MSTITLIVWIILFVAPPCIIILMEKDAPRGAKVGGFIASLLFSWLGLGAYYLLRILKKQAAYTS